MSAPEEGPTTLINGAESEIKQPDLGKPPASRKTSTEPSATKQEGPLRLDRPDGEPDDLKLISGVGPKLEQKLNALGFWHYGQIANWTKKHIKIVDDELSFKGRIERDDWVKQAKALAKGGAAEYEKVFGKKPR
jgi:NADH-quinone oxidoreductase subunit E